MIRFPAPDKTAFILGDYFGMSTIGFTELRIVGQKRIASLDDADWPISALKEDERIAVTNSGQVTTLELFI